MNSNKSFVALGSNIKLQAPAHKLNAITEAIQKEVVINRELSHPGTAMPEHIQQTSTAMAKNSVQKHNNKTFINEQTQIQSLDSKTEINDVEINQPLLETGEDKTDKSDRTDLVISNSNFIVGIFGETVGTERPIVVSFSGNPSKVGRNSWFGKPWIDGKTPLSDKLKITPVLQLLNLIMRASIVVKKNYSQVFMP